MSSTKTDLSKTQGGSSTQQIDPGAEIKIQHLFKLMIDSKASDLHLTPGAPPAMRIHGEIARVKLPPLSGEDTKRLIYQVLGEEQRSYLEKNLSLDFSFGIKGLARFRGSAFFSRGNIAGAFRLIPSIIPSFADLGLPKVLLEMTDTANGLILITGPTGSGKSTTLAAIMDHLNANKHGHIVTLEDPVEFIHTHKMSIINQREVGTDSHDFRSALKGLLRQDPDIVLVGELRDTETIELALNIAETGHLVFGTLHTNSCVQTLTRIISAFEHGQQQQIRTLLSFVLRGVVAQQLITKSFEPGRVCAQEILVINPSIKNLIREDKLHQIYSQMQIGQEKTGMKTMNQNLCELVDRGVISREQALSYSPSIEELEKNFGTSRRRRA